MVRSKQIFIIKTDFTNGKKNAASVSKKNGVVGLKKSGGIGLKKKAVIGLKYIVGGGSKKIVETGLEKNAVIESKVSDESGLKKEAGHDLDKINGSGSENVAEIGSKKSDGSGLKKKAGDALDKINGSGSGSGLKKKTVIGLKNIVGGGLKKIIKKGPVKSVISALQQNAAVGLKNSVGSELKKKAIIDLKNPAGDGLEKTNGRVSENIAVIDSENSGGSGSKNKAGNGSKSDCEQFVEKPSVERATSEGADGEITPPSRRRTLKEIDEMVKSVRKGYNEMYQKVDLNQLPRNPRMARRFQSTEGQSAEERALREQQANASRKSRDIKKLTDASIITEDEFLKINLIKYLAFVVTAKALRKKKCENSGCGY